MKINRIFSANPHNIYIKNLVTDEYKDELLIKLLMDNLKREIIFSIILVVIDFSLLGVDFIATSGWSNEKHIFRHFSNYHLLLIIVPAVFLVLTYILRQHSKVSIKVYRVLHWTINMLVLVLCAIVSTNDDLIVKMPYAYIIAMFCIGSTVLLGNKERLILYLVSYIIFAERFILNCTDIYRITETIFFSTILVSLALIVSHIQYSSYVRDFINQKIIMDKNKELDVLYRETEEALKQRTRELNETVEYEKLRIAFFANISHELRTPLTVIFSAEQMLDLFIKKDDLQNRMSEVRQYMEVIRQNCYRLIRLVANLIDITKIDAGYFQVSFKNCDIIKVVEDIAQSVAVFIKDREIELVFDTDVEELVVACDPDKIERIILNLLSNAVKFTPKGGCIYVDVHEKMESVEIHVKDTGIGIPENMKQRIFERFVQVDKTTSRSHEGSGIGLSIVKSLVEMHEGTLTLNSEEGKGSEFIIELPKRMVVCEAEERDNNFVSENQSVEKINIEFSDIYK